MLVNEDFPWGLSSSFVRSVRMLRGLRRSHSSHSNELRHGRSVQFLLPDPVIAYIHAHQLFTSKA